MHNMTDDKKEFMRKKNPYHPYMPKVGKWFYDQEVVRQIRECLESQTKKGTILLKGKTGSGKTSTLKKIVADSQRMLGSAYIPVLLDIEKYLELSSDDFIFLIYKDIIDALSISGIRPDGVDSLSIRQCTLNNDIQSFSRAFVSFWPAGKTLVLMLDEFHGLFADPGKKKFHTIIEYLQGIGERLNNFWLIAVITEGIPIFKVTSKERIFLDSANTITAREFFNEEKIKEFISEPVRDRFMYEANAVKEIIKASGKNLYFQQLICFYIYNNMEDNKSICTLGDVKEAVRQLLVDARPELEYAWDNLLPLETKLILSALVDEDVTIKVGQFYHLGEKGIMDDILGNRFHEALKKTYNSGYIINNFENRRFPGYPIRIPLLGMWICREHPFIKTILENIDRLADRIDLEKIIKEIKEIPGDKLTPFDESSIVEISQAWLSLKKNIIRKEIRTTRETETTFSFVKVLSKFVGGKVSSEGVDIVGCVRFYIRSLNIGNSNEAYCFTQRRPVLSPGDISDIEYAATSYSQDNRSILTIYFCLEKNELLEELAKKPYLDVVLIDENDLKKIILSEFPYRAFRKIILSGLSLQKISPYQTTGPAKATFYGRGKIIDLISGAKGSSFAIVGPRKIGKSSLLYKLIEQQPPNTYYIFLDMQIEIGSYGAFLKALEFEIRITLGEKVDFENNISTLPGIFRRLSSRKGRRIIFILDEIDHFLEFDRKNNYKVLSTFRSMAQNNICRFVLAGFKTLYNDKRKLDSPLYNFCEEIQLPPLDRESAIGLITGPMKSIGVEYACKGDKELILEYTACHPNLLQFFGRHLIEKVEVHERVEDRRKIFREDIDNLFDSKYEEYIIDDIYMFYSDLPGINKLIIIIFIEELAGKKSVTAEKIKRRLKAHGIIKTINQVHQALKTLTMRFILKDTGKGRYCFALPVFPEMLKNRIDEDFKETLIQEEVMANDSKSL